MKRTNTAVWLENYNRWQIKVQKDGKRKTFTCSTPGRKGQRECNAKADAWLDDGIENTNLRIQQLFDDYIEELKMRTSKSHWSGELTRGQTWLIPTKGNLKIDKLNDAHIQEIINSAYQKGLSKKTLSNIKNTICAFIKYCRKRKLTTYYPEDIIIPKGAKVGKRTILQPSDLKILFSVDTTILNGKRVYDDYVNAYRFQVITGVRPGEMLGLKWSDIENNIVHIQRSINVHNEITTGKNENAIRNFVLTPTAKSILEKQKRLTGHNEFVFGGGILERGYHGRLKKYCVANNIPVVTPYELRHTFVSVIQSLPEAQIKATVGHSKSMDTFGIYAHETTNLATNIANNIDSVFKDILEATNNPKK